MGLLDLMQKGCERFAELAERNPDVSRRNVLKGAGAGVAGAAALAVGLDAVLPGSAEAAEYNAQGFAVPDVNKMKWEITENRWADRFKAYDGNDTYVEVFRGKGKDQLAVYVVKAFGTRLAFC